MLRILAARLGQGHRTIRYPARPPPALPERFRGLPDYDAQKCPDAASCRRCADACPTEAIEIVRGTNDRSAPRFDLGRCIFCEDCTRACPEGALRMGRDYRLAASRREDLLYAPSEAQALRTAAAMGRRLRRLLGRSLRFREVSAGGCAACDADSNVLTTVGWDIGRFGVQFVASPRHADGLWVTGPVTENMGLALEKTWRAVPEPRIVLAVGACAISGGLYRGSDVVSGGLEGVLPVDLYIPGCPPHPLTILDGLLRLLGRIPEALAQAGE
jgi:Ni,Fe-hydrogenase III small subunit/ferredoxin